MKRESESGQEPTEPTLDQVSQPGRDLTIEPASRFSASYGAYSIANRAYEPAYVNPGGYHLIIDAFPGADYEDGARAGQLRLDSDVASYEFALAGPGLERSTVSPVRSHRIEREARAFRLATWIDD